MFGSLSTTTVPASAGSPAPHRVARARLTVVRTALALAAAVETAWLVVHPGPPRGDLGYASIAPARDVVWAAYLVDMVAFATVAAMFALVACALAPARGGTWATVGAVLTAGGGFLFATGPWAMAVMFWYATDTSVLPAATGTAFVDHVHANLEHVVGPQFVGLLGFCVGVLLLAVALWRSRSVPRWLPAALAVLVVGQFVSPGDRVLDFVQAALMVALGSAAWFARPAAAH